MNPIKEFIQSEDAAVTVDWVVLTAAIVTLGLVVITIITGSVVGHGNTVESHLRTQSVGLPNGG